MNEWVHHSIPAAIGTAVCQSLTFHLPWILYLIWPMGVAYYEWQFFWCVFFWGGGCWTALSKHPGGSQYHSNERLVPYWQNLLAWTLMPDLLSCGPPQVPIRYPIKGGGYQGILFTLLPFVWEHWIRAVSYHTLLGLPHATWCGGDTSKIGVTSIDGKLWFWVVFLPLAFLSWSFQPAGFSTYSHS